MVDLPNACATPVGDRPRHNPGGQGLRHRGPGLLGRLRRRLHLLLLCSSTLLRKERFPLALDSSILMSVCWSAAVWYSGSICWPDLLTSGRWRWRRRLALVGWAVWAWGWAAGTRSTAPRTAAVATMAFVGRPAARSSKHRLLARRP